MRNIVYIFFFTFILIMELTTGKKHSKFENGGASGKKQVSVKINDRFKRSLDGNNQLLWAKNKKILHGSLVNSKFHETVEDENNNNIDMEKDIPFWGSRGRRDSSSVENYIGNPMPSEMKLYDKLCENCFADGDVRYTKERRDKNDSPFWGSRGRRLNDVFPLRNRGIQQVTLSDINQVMSENMPFWANRGRRNEAEPFWASRGNREEFGPFWGNRGRREKVSSWESNDRKEESEPFWGSRGRREETEPFWGSRGRREESEPFWGSRGRREESEPFWGSRGRREETEPFWGSRGKREKSEPFWGMRGRKENIESFSGNQGRMEETEPFWGSRGRRLESHEEKTHPHTVYYNLPQDNLKQSIKDAIEAVENNIELLSRFRRSKSSFWSSRGRNSQLDFLSNNARNRYQPPNKILKSGHSTMNYKPSESSTVLDDRVYAEQPSYIVVERSGRSSAEDDPFFISRGKKKFRDLGVAQAVRDRRGVIEELVKTVQNDPYFIARGKKDTDLGKTGNISVSNEDLTKARDLICSTADLILNKSKEHIFKREAPDNERSRRTTLKKLAAQLQMDPYFVSRGKKSGIDDSNADNFEDFIRDILEKCY